MSQITLRDLTDITICEKAIHSAHTPRACPVRRPATITRCSAPQAARRSCGRFAFPHGNGHACSRPRCRYPEDYQRLTFLPSKAQVAFPKRYRGTHSEPPSVVEVSIAVRRFIRNAVRQCVQRSDEVGAAARLVRGGDTREVDECRPKEWTPKWMAPRDKKLYADEMTNLWRIECQHRLALEVQRKAKRLPKGVSDEWL